MSRIALLLVTLFFAQTTKPETVRPMLWQPEMKPSDVGEINVFRRFPRELRDKMVQFYEQVLGIKPLPGTALGGNNAQRQRDSAQPQTMIRYPIGGSEVKLFPVAMGDPNRARPVRDVIGIRLLTFFFPDEASVAARFKQHGYPAPVFRSNTALVQDPDGQWVELIIVPGAPASTYSRFEIGMTVSDIEKSRAFYRDFVGMDEERPAQHPVLGTTKYSYRSGATTINLWSFGKDLPKDTNSAGIQYITWDVVAVDRVAKARNATIDRPLSAPGPTRTVWLFDPDQITN